MERFCMDCEKFRKIFGGKNGGGQKCPDDTTEGRRVIYARDYACDKFVEAK